VDLERNAEQDLLERRFIEALVSNGRVEAVHCPLPVEARAALGLREVAAWIELPTAWDPLSEPAIREALTAKAGAWLRSLQVWPVIGSTNTELVTRSHSESIEGHVCLAELQLQGRGRRGRVWLSPIGGNLALSLGFSTFRAPAELGGLSLVVGLAVIDALETLGVPGLSLKWPNDILLNGAKLGGILIELLQVEGGLALVIGLGINVRLPDGTRDRVGQEVADLASLQCRLPSRSILAARAISSIVEFQQAFERSGFGPFVSAFDQRHYYGDKDVQIVHGENTILGRVLGVALDGSLKIDAESGLREVHGGEVSLRPAPLGRL